MTQRPDAPMTTDSTPIEELVRQFFEGDSPESLEDVRHDFLAGVDRYPMVELSAEEDEDDEQDALYTEVTQRALLHIPVSEAEIDKRLNTDTK
jgi:hypothetical protein